VNRAIGRVGKAVVILLVVLIGMLTYWQMIDAKELKNDPLNVRAALADINQPRGPIVTADGQTVAESKRVHDGSEFDFQRVYAHGQAYQQVVGYQSFLIGSVGVERTYNDELVGRDPELRIRNLTNAFQEEPTGTVVLSLRADLQNAAIQALGSEHGSVVAINPQTGEILAMYSNPSYDPTPLVSHNSKTVRDANKALLADPSKPDLARSYRERYAPGSTFKTVTASVGIEDGVTSPDHVYPVRSSYTPPQTTSAIQGFGGESCGGTLAESLTESCNPTFANLGVDIGEQFVAGMAKFGIGSEIPIDIIPSAAVSTGPEPGSFADNKPQFALAGIGQGPVATTPLQMALVAAGLANGGVIMRPHVVKEIRDAKGKVVRRIQPREWKTAVSPGTAAAVTAMMVSVVQSGTGTAAQIPGIPVAGKTGTAEINLSGLNQPWFIAFAPRDKPKIAIAVTIERAQGGQGGTVAAPVAKQVLQELIG
jgi:peptidoglycan glycosyltransferase